MEIKALGIAVLATISVTATSAAAQESHTELAKQLSNPVASLISLPFQYNYDSGYGPNDGSRTTLNIQPVAPFSISDDWNVISRTIIPVIWQNDIAGDSGHQSGLGDIVQSFFFSPKAPTASGLIWGVGPVFLLPTGDEDLGSEKWGAGPTGVVLKQNGPWTMGALANHIWSFAGEDDRNDVSATFLQPFLTYTTANAVTFALNTESTYDWESEQWSVPINLQVSKLTNLGGQPISFQIGARYWAEAPEAAADDWGLRASVTFLYPRN